MMVLYSVYIKSEDIYHNLRLNSQIKGESQKAGFTLWHIADVFSVTGKINENMFLKCR